MRNSFMHAFHGHTQSFQKNTRSSHNPIQCAQCALRILTFSLTRVAILMQLNIEYSTLYGSNREHPRCRRCHRHHGRRRRPWLFILTRLITYIVRDSVALCVRVHSMWLRAQKRCQLCVCNCCATPELPDTQKSTTNQKQYDREPVAKSKHTSAPESLFYDQVIYDPERERER